MCGGFDFASFRSDGADIDPLAAYTYDAVLYLAKILDYYFRTVNATMIDPQRLYSTATGAGVHVEGVTGNLTCGVGVDSYEYVHTTSPLSPLSSLFVALISAIFVAFVVRICTTEYIHCTSR